ncbi:MAG: hypothetical protein IME93_03240 [Proteobacteria bacterium]|nr:hypothetical protein [Pseudomonadota bacterium]
MDVKRYISTRGMMPATASIALGKPLTRYVKYTDYQALEVERDRYKEALEKIAEKDRCMADSHCSIPEIAQQALKGESNGR